MTRDAGLPRDFGDAFQFIFDARESQRAASQVGGIAALAAAARAPQGDRRGDGDRARRSRSRSGSWLGHTGARRVRRPSRSPTSGRAVPSFALLAFFIAFLRHSASPTSCSPSCCSPSRRSSPTPTSACGRSTATPSTPRAGMGLTGAQIVRRVELPLALPLIFGGIRTSTVNVIATATLGPLVGVVTLGDPIITANVYGEPARLGAVDPRRRARDGAEVGLSAVQRAVTPTGVKLAARRPRPARLDPLKGGSDVRMKTRPARSLAAAAGAARAFAVAACGDDDDDSERRDALDRRRGRRRRQIQHNDGQRRRTLTVGSKNFTEQNVLGEIYAQALEAAGYTVKKRAQPRRRADRLQGAQGRRDRRLPGVHRARR